MLKNSNLAILSWRNRWWSLLSTLVCLSCSFMDVQTQNHRNYHCNLTTLRLLTMLPYRDESSAYNPSWDQGLDILPALDLAAEQINNRLDILPCHQLELVHVDGGCDIVPKTSLGIVNGLFGAGNETVVGAVGPGCSVSSVAMSKIANNPKIELVILHDAGTPLLANRTAYNNSIGILGSTQPFADLSFALMWETGWRHIAILFESTRLYYRSTTQNFINRTKEVPDVKILFQAAIFTNFYPLDEVRNSLARIVFLFMSPEHSRRIMCLAYHKRLVYPGYQWIIASRRLDDFNTSVSFDYDRVHYSCSCDILLTIALEKVFLMSYQLSAEQTSANVKPLLNITFSELFQHYNERVSDYNSYSNSEISPTYWAYNMYDAIWAWAIVLHNLTSKHDGLKFEYGNQTLANMILDEFYLVDFQGMSGNISFNSNNGFVNRQTNLYQIIIGSEKFVTATDGSGEIVFEVGSYDAIPDIVKVVGLPHLQLVGFFITFQCLEFIVVTTLHVFTVTYRKEKHVKASSPQLSHFVFLGLYLLISATLVLSASEINQFNPEISGIFCHTMWAWLLPFGFTLIVGTVAVRTWRLYRIFTHYLHPGRFISTPALVVILLSLLFIDLLIAVVWTSTDPMQQVLVNFMVENGSANEQMQDRMCMSRQNLLWIILVHGYRLALLAFVVMLTILTRSIPNKTFATSSLAVFSYPFLTVYVFGFTTFYLILFINHNPNADYGILSITFNTMICLIIACIAAPPLFPVAREKMDRYFQTLSLPLNHQTNLNNLRKTM